MTDNKNSPRMQPRTGSGEPPVVQPRRYCIKHAPRQPECPRGCDQSLTDYNSIWFLCESCDWLVARDSIATRTPAPPLENALRKRPPHDQVLERFARIDAEVRAEAADTDVANPEYERGMLRAADMFGVVKQCATRLKREAEQKQADRDGVSTRVACPCELVAPCSKNCTCANGFLSGGCSRCCKYGSDEQKLAAAVRLASLAGEIESWRADACKQNDALSVELGRVRRARGHLENCTCVCGHVAEARAVLGKGSDV